jgi:hypothetical protein
MAYEWLCGHRPFLGEGVELIVQHMSSPPPPLRRHNPSISPAVEEVVLKALEKNPQRRYPSVQAFARALELACDWRAADFSLSPHIASSPDRQEIDDAVTSFSFSWEVDAPPYARETKGFRADEESYAPLMEQKLTTGLARKAQRRRSGFLSLSSRESKQNPFLIAGLIVLVLILVSSGLFSLQRPGPLSVLAFGGQPTATPRLTATPQPVATPPPLLATADFGRSPTRVQGMTLRVNQTIFAGDHSVLDAGQVIVVDFTLHASPGKPKRTSIVIKALVSRLGDTTPGYAPIDLYCNGQPFVKDFTIPGQGFQPDMVSLQIPPGQLVAGKNELKLLASSDAVSLFWIYSLEVTSGMGTS